MHCWQLTDAAVQDLLGESYCVPRQLGDLTPRKARNIDTWRGEVWLVSPTAGSGERLEVGAPASPCAILPCHVFVCLLGLLLNLATCSPAHRVDRTRMRCASCSCEALLRIAGQQTISLGCRSPAKRSPGAPACPRQSRSQHAVKTGRSPAGAQRRRLTPCNMPQNDDCACAGPATVPASGASLTSS